jgi:hypothetical protein
VAAEVSDKITSLENEIQNKLVYIKVKLLMEAAAVRAKMDSNLEQMRSRMFLQPTDHYGADSNTTPQII